MPAPIRKRIKKLSGILRIADGLDRSHYQNVKDLEVFSEEDHIKINIRTEGEPYLEIWGAERKSDLFKEITGKKLKIERVMEPTYIG
jgi:exopolyphosphatase/guanosine-5'-triphosphate,3'-diphosphate pyrophosphatase